MSQKPPNEDKPGSLFRGGVNCCFRHSVHQLLNHIPSIGRSEAFIDYLKEDKVRREKKPDQEQEDAGLYLMEILEKEKWLNRLWKRECGIRFTDCRLRKETAKWQCKRGMEKETLIVVHPDTRQSLSKCIKESLSTITSELVAMKRIQHPPPRYLVINFSDKVESSTPLDYFKKLDFSPGISYEAIGFVVHLFAGFGHYVYITRDGSILNDLTEEIKKVDLSTLTFDSRVSPTLVLYRRISRRSLSKRFLRRNL